ncbi:MAG TPA: SPOR domain-containing protein [Novosphingobium sp.]
MNVGTKQGLRIAALAAALLVSAPALADVKAGVDAWTRGDYAAAVREWQGPATKGDADAQFNLAQAYKLGRGVRQDLKQAEDLFAKAAAQGHLQAGDNYGLLLFQRGERAKALPYLQAAAGRGDPRAQYLLGIAHFNGDIVPRDWVRAYALTSLARQAGLGQAGSALAEMDQHVPLEQRQQAATLAARLAGEADATRARQFAAADLAATGQAPDGPPRNSSAFGGRTVASDPTLAPPPARSREPAPERATPRASTESAARMAQDARGVGGELLRLTPRTPAPPPAKPPARVAAGPAAKPAPTTPRAEPRPTPAVTNGPWRVQLGAFAVPGNAEGLWARLRGRAELAGHARMLLPSGRVTRLLAGGFASQRDAQAACSRLSAAGHPCLPVRN